ncbi:MAG: hypothetical protein ACK5P7_13105 [Bdellovibrio sp.]
MKGYIGKKVRVVYTVRETQNPNQEVFIYGADITGEVTLKDFDLSKRTVTFERSNGKTETMNPVLVLSEEE